MTDPASHKQWFNRRLPEMLADARKREPIALLCECDDDACFRVVWLSWWEYTWITGDSARVIAPDHAVVPVLARAAA